MKIGILNISDRASRGEYEDLPGKTLRQLLLEAMANEVEFVYQVIPDEQPLIESFLKSWSDSLDACQLIFTCGGTGLSPRDVTPEATLSVAHKVVPGIGELLRTAGAQHIATAVLSRQTAVIRHQTLIINFPGSIKAQAQSFQTIQPILKHALEQLNGHSILWKTTNP